ncbi:Putative multidrug resistance protein MdtD [Streptomyces violaceorubidus]
MRTSMDHWSAHQEEAAFLDVFHEVFTLLAAGLPAPPRSLRAGLATHQDPPHERCRDRYPGARRRASHLDDHLQILQAMSGLMAGMFVAILAGTVVANALPTIIADLGASQSSYTWVVTSELLAMTATVPLWGKLSDLFNKKLLLQLSLGMFVVGSLLAGFSHGVGLLIFSRVVQGIGAGGLTALAQVVMASVIPPRQLGKYSFRHLRCRLRRGHRGRTAGRRCPGGHLVAGLALVLLHRRAVRAARHRPAAAHPAPAHGEARGPHRLARRVPDRRRGLRPADRRVSRPATSSTGRPGRPVPSRAAAYCCWSRRCSSSPARPSR